MPVEAGRWHGIAIGEVLGVPGDMVGALASQFLPLKEAIRPEAGSAS